MHLLSLKIPEKLNLVKNYTSFLDNLNPTNKQRLYHYNSQLQSIVLCEICGINPANWGDRVGYSTCSPDCKKSKIQNTTEKRFGVKNFGQTERSKSRASTQFKDPEFRQKLAEGMKSKYGIENYGQSSTNIARFKSNNPAKDANYVAKKEASSLSRYGETSYSKTSEFKDGQRKRNQRLYGTDWWFQSTEHKNIAFNRLQDYIGVDYTLTAIEYPYIKYTHNICGNECIMNAVTFHRRKRLNVELCNHCMPSFNSALEHDLFKYVESIANTAVKTKCRDIITPQELDIVVPGVKLAMEFNGIYWHTDAFLSPTYHQRKSQMCEDMGYKLLHIWEDWWYLYSDVIKSIISGYLRLNSKIAARKCTIKPLTDKIARDFNESNHLQGHSPSSVTYGLYHEYELVQLMSFKQANNGWEINRSCSKPFVTVVGGFSKLLSHFKLSHNPRRIVSFVMRDVFTGSSYLKAGFKLQGITNPGYCWVNDRDWTRLSRQQCQKHKLVAQGFEGTENSIMRSRGFNRLFNSGNYKFVWENNS